MIRATLIAAGKMRPGPEKTIYDDYARRLSWPLTLHEIVARDNAAEATRMEEKLDRQAFIFALDEKGKSLRSRDFADRLGALAAEGRPDIQFVIGGADGLTPALKNRAHFLLSFGAQTWPHMLARVMLTEQLYRAQQILSGHPYHRD